MSFQTLEAVASRTRVVRVNLLPPDFEIARRNKLVRLALGAGVLVVGGFCVAASVVTSGHVGTAESALQASQAQTASLQAEQTPYAEVPKVYSDLKTVQAAESTIKATDVPWYSYLDQVAATAPTDLSLTSLTFAVVADSSATTGTDPLAPGGIGTLSITAQTTSESKVADWLDSVSTIPGLTYPKLGQSSYNATTGVVAFDATTTITNEALSANR